MNLGFLKRVLTNGNTYSVTVNSDGLNPLLASVSWTDKPGAVSEGLVNDATAVLVNDLDIKITKKLVFLRHGDLTGVNSNEKGDNIVDPFERVDVAKSFWRVYHYSYSQRNFGRGTKFFFNCNWYCW